MDLVHLVLIEFMIIGVMVLIPLIFTEALPKGTTMFMLVAPPPPPTAAASGRGSGKSREADPDRHRER